MANRDEAAKLYRKVIRKNPREANALHSLGSSSPPPAT
jgi:hypothetical protein